MRTNNVRVNLKIPVSLLTSHRGIRRPIEEIFQEILFIYKAGKELERLQELQEKLEKLNTKAIDTKTK